VYFRNLEGYGRMSVKMILRREVISMRSGWKFLGISLRELFALTFAETFGSAAVILISIFSFQIEYFANKIR
jgi:hypothetical protein